MTPTEALKTEKGWRAFCGQAGMLCLKCGGRLRADRVWFIDYKPEYGLKCTKCSNFYIRKLFPRNVDSPYSITEVTADAIWPSNAPRGWREVVMEAVDQ